MPVIFFGRHGETNEDLPDNDVVSGWNDVPLNATGRVNASRAARRLKDLEITSITASDTPRAHQTAKIISNYLDMPMVSSERLRSWDMGALTGLDREVAKPFLTFFEKNPDIRVPKGEAFGIFYNRFKGVFWHFVAHVRKFPEARPLLVTHSQDLGILQWLIDEVGPGRVLEGKHVLDPGGLLEIRIDGSKITMRKLKV